MKFNMPTCGGCRTCEMACSFKHSGEFIPSISSIRITDKERGPGYDVVLAEKSDGRNMSCDGCYDLREPLCIQYCNKSEDLGKILREFLEKMETAGKKND